MPDIFFSVHKHVEAGSGPLQQNNHTKTEWIGCKNEKYNDSQNNLNFMLQSIVF